MLPPRMHCSERCRRSDESRMQIVAIAFRNVVQAVDSHGKKDIELPKEPQSCFQDVII